MMAVMESAEPDQPPEALNGNSRPDSSRQGGGSDGLTGRVETASSPPEGLPLAQDQCSRCGQPFCPVYLRLLHGSPVCPSCLNGLRRRRLKIFCVVALMAGAPAVVIAWGLHHRLSRLSPSSEIDSKALASNRIELAAEINARLEHAEHLARSGRRDQAKIVLSRLLGESPDHPGALLALARLSRQEADYQSLLRHTTRLVTLRPGAIEARLWQAEALLALGQPDRAEDTLRKGTQTAPRSGRLALALTALLMTLNKRQEALKTLRAVLLARPDGEEAAIRTQLRALETASPYRSSPLSGRR